eukprot:TRINITY_DN39056_c0_g1_i1.p1 TRINITY_DN39056_c0_g1~~TRINITY_DN39056_c0_g1_i1.p1  ORF type:complete len:133 (+),score=11.16 TRINITY_DN39056_c0_g1_i1:69-467(+)
MLRSVLSASILVAAASGLRLGEHDSANATDHASGSGDLACWCCWAEKKTGSNVHPGIMCNSFYTTDKFIFNSGKLTKPSRNCYEGHWLMPSAARGTLADKLDDQFFTDSPGNGQALDACNEEAGKRNPGWLK